MKQTRLITDAAILLAIYTVLLAITIYVPIIEVVAFFFLSTPFILFVYRHNIKTAWFMLAGALIASFLLNPVLALPATIMCGLAGTSMGYFYKKQQPLMALSFGTLSFLVGTLLTYIGSIVLFDLNLFTVIADEMKRSLQEQVNILSSFGQGVPKEAIDQMLNQFDLLSMVLPTVIVIFSFILAILTHIANRPILTRLKLEYKPLKPFREWQLPKSIIWYYLVVILVQFMNIEKGSFLFVAVINVAIVLQLLLLVQGLSFIFYYSYLKNQSKWLPTIAVVIAIIAYPVQEFIRILGIIDLGFDLRGKLKR
ncbi:YybS family protein [Bacillus sp. FJAT-47783]|uniref:YybS family protein n=1 Tax=Bacillus sp. FJAT-47783 TaxID=2922712 RepID=UPI001FADC75D|nr:YybS family protein [Bacillus sp. FJAT-47783]